MKVCKYCRKEFTPKNPKGKFCSDKCRVYASRVVKSDKPIIDYTPPPIITSPANAAKVNAAFKDVFDSVAIEKQIDAIKKEKIPEIRNTLYGRKVWQKEQDAKIAELQKQLK